ncbi:aminoglycoside phosphotransferase family protein [Kribbella amoyensis]|uniref:aminoglycoside phosphotransferase family protein n=1 Tax=Kribbella amoyensis TaxID=996641 RepID=UPI001479673E|nr:aminoglycoside phosphotransferase family protein [Kribbella amoyensis]
MAGELARRLAVPAPPEIPRLAGAAVGWEQQLVAQCKEAGDPLPARVIGAAVETIRAFAADPTDTLMHGDLHLGNILAAEREPWLVIDPKGFAGSAAYDAGTIVRYRPEEVAGDVRGGLLRRIAIFSEAAGVDRVLAVRATQARMVSGALWGRLYGEPAEAIALADLVAEALV